MLAHVSIRCADASASRPHEAVLAPLGAKALRDFGEHVVFGREGGFVRDPDGNNVEARDLPAPD
ncbi:MAG TPA: hypothetical protein VM143_02295 [Acidimicrobiales bacterium]|nr:hypothetical protein [Acidimicrobiales bacterium]